MRKQARRQVEVAGLSFLDCICCGFGAVILLLVVVKIHDPILTEEQREALIALLARLEAHVEDIADERARLESEVESARAAASGLQARAQSLAARLAEARGAKGEAEKESESQKQLQEAMKRAEQQLTTEAERRRASRRVEQTQTVGGIPADSEYVIFVIDTSGSMQNYSWELVARKVEETLDVYPALKGIQVMNDMGNYMFPGYSGRWIPDTPSRRRNILRQLRAWRAFSNSSPVEGIEAAIQTFHDWDKEISIYVFGDEFSGGSVQDVIDRVDHLNRADARGRRRVRIHAVGFTIDTTNLQFRITSRRFAALMRALCHRNGGTFVGL
ncbi:MAG: VWA domain-containing protein [Myxococcota bacterium]|nr:VWA domain-containing protein [Myxococcota bacterium]